MLPRLIIHNVTSLDGRLDVSQADVGLYYELAQQFQADAILSGSKTMLAAYPPEQSTDEGASEGQEKPKNARPLLVVVDSRGRIRNWRRIRNEPYWGHTVVLCSRATPKEYLDYVDKVGVDRIVTGNDRVDLSAALEELNARFQVQIVRVDSGGILNGVLLHAGLVDEISVMIDPCLIGDQSPHPFIAAPRMTTPGTAISLKLIAMEQVRGDTVWLRYEITK